MNFYLVYYNSAAQTMVSFISTTSVEDAIQAFCLEYPTVPVNQIKWKPITNRFQHFILD